MVKAIWQGKTIAESNNTIVVEGNHYFPPADVNTEFLTTSDHTSYCPWKGTASYHHVLVNGLEATNGAWFYPEVKPKAEEIKDHLAFWKGVEVTG